VKQLAGSRPDGVLAAILVLTAVVHLTSFQKGLGWGDDSSAYIHQAKSLVEGSVPQLRSMAAFRFANSTTEVMVGPPLYPWGLPILLSPVYAVFGLEVLPMKALILAFALAAQAMTFYLLRGRLSDGWPLLIAFTMAINPVFFRFKNDILSDIPFAFFALLSLFLMQKVVVEGRRYFGPTLDCLFLGLAVSCAVLVRTHGVALLPTLAVVQLVQAWSWKDGSLTRAARSAIGRLRPSSIIPYVVVAAGDFLTTAFLSGRESSYVASGHFAYGGPGAVIALIARNTAYYADLPSKFLHPSAVGRALNILVFMPCALFGASRRFQRDYVLLVFTAFYMAVLLVFPFHQGVRFIIPVMPIYFYFAIAGAIEAQAPLARRLPSLKRLPSLALLVFVPTSAFLAVSVAVGWTSVATHPGAVLEGPYTKTSLEVLDYIRRNTAESAVITFWKPRALMLFTGRRSIFNMQPGEIVDGRSDYLLVYAGTLKRENARRINERMRGAVSVRPERFRLVLENADFLLYRIPPEETGGTARLAAPLGMRSE
jgi:hypothetical protein